jgi:hypothetical protein
MGTIARLSWSLVALDASLAALSMGATLKTEALSSYAIGLHIVLGAAGISGHLVTALGGHSTVTSILRL